MTSSRASITFGSVPRLEQTLADEASEPFSLSDFKKYLKTNHCYEALDFYFDVRDYYDISQTNDQAFLNKKWRQIMKTYISVGSPKEINITEENREKLRSLTGGNCPLTPELSRKILNFAIDTLHDSVYLQFINEQTSCARASIQNGAINSLDVKEALASNQCLVHNKHTNKACINKRLSFRRENDSDQDSDYYESNSTDKANHSAGSSLTQVSPTTHNFNEDNKIDAPLSPSAFKQWSLMPRSDKNSEEALDSPRSRTWQRMSAVFRKHVHS